MPDGICITVMSGFSRTIADRNHQSCGTVRSAEASGAAKHAHATTLEPLRDLRLEDLPFAVVREGSHALQARPAGRRASCYFCVDHAGNGGSKRSVVTVPHDRGR